MFVLYAVAHVVMSRTTFGGMSMRSAATRRRPAWPASGSGCCFFAVYTICGLLAGLGGVIMASQLKSGAPTYGLTYELYVIAAVVVGGTSLSGGEGRILGTLIGAFVIGVVQNGMNLTNVEHIRKKWYSGLSFSAPCFWTDSSRSACRCGKNDAAAGMGRQVEIRKERTVRVIIWTLAICLAACASLLQARKRRRRMIRSHDWRSWRPPTSTLSGGGRSRTRSTNSSRTRSAETTP